MSFLKRLSRLLGAASLLLASVYVVIYNSRSYRNSGPFNLSSFRINNETYSFRNVSTNLCLANYSLDGVGKTVPAYARPSMNAQQMQWMRLLVRDFRDAAEGMKIPYFMISGTLLGSYRHHGLMPWDDDADFLIPISKKEFTYNAIKEWSKNNQPDLQIAIAPGNRYKIFRYSMSEKVKLKNYNFRWPLIDLCFYNENERALWQYQRSNYLKKSIIFPLHLRPFEGVYLWAPKDSFAVLNALYKNKHCVSLLYNHRFEKWIRNVNFKCEAVKDAYAFVHRAVVPGVGMLESLQFDNGTVLHQVVVDEPLYAVSRPYSFQLA